MLPRRSIGWPIVLGVLMMVTLVVLAICWIAYTGSERLWGLLWVGTTLMGLVLVGVVFYLILSIKEIRLNQRQSNFMDSITHELKSPIASLKLYLQTLGRGDVSEAEQADFHRFMLDDLDRLDRLINHLLDAARLDQQPVESEAVDVELSAVLRNVAQTACQRYRVPNQTVELKLQPSCVHGRPVDIEMVFRNLVDNALKYAGDKPWVAVESYVNGHGLVVTRVSDNGPGIPAKLRRKIFRRFVRLGNELERAKPGTGLGLFIVRELVRRMRGDVTVRGRTGNPGTVFEVQLPGRPLPTS